MTLQCATAKNSPSKLEGVPEGGRECVLPQSHFCKVVSYKVDSLHFCMVADYIVHPFQYKNVRMTFFLDKKYKNIAIYLGGVKINL